MISRLCLKEAVEAESDDRVRGERASKATRVQTWP